MAPTGMLTRLDERGTLISQLFKVNKGHIIAAAPKTAGDPLRLLNIAYNAIAYDPKLLECTQESLIGGVFEALKLGLTLGGPMQEAWLIPFKVHGVPTATFIVGYMGYRNIIDRAGSVIDMHPRAVHNGRRKGPQGFVDGTPDEFEYWFGDQPRIIHKPRNPMPQFREQLRAVYVVANLRRGGKQLEVLEPDEVEAHRQRSRAKDNGPWITDYVPMGLKTGMRKISKYLPKSNELLARALDLDEKADLGVSQGFEIPPDVKFLDEPGREPQQPASPMDRLKNAIGAGQPEQQKAAEGAPPSAEDITWG